MKHIHVDEFARLNSPLHRLDPRAKAVAIFVFIIITVSISDSLPLLLAVFLLSGILMSVGIPLSYIIRRISWILPFTGLVVVFFPFIIPGDIVWTGQVGFLRLVITEQGIDRAVIIFLRVLVSVLCLVTLVSTTKFNNLLKALSDLRIPGVILQMVEFTLRYIFVIVDELKRMRRARKARGFTSGAGLWDLRSLKTIAQMIGVMFIRAYERGDRVYVAMLSRGFTGHIKTMQTFTLTLKDGLFAGTLILVALILLALDKGGLAL